jgi:pimeloyl-ACP methyl ester carboxylesterase
MLNGIKSRYLERGEGRPLLLIHGVGPGASAESWAYQIDEFSSKFRVFALDLVGLGQTAKPDLEYSYELLVNQVSSFIDVFCIEDLDIVGASTGAYIAIKYGLENPHRVRRIILAGSATIARSMGVNMLKPKQPPPGTKYDGTEKSMKDYLKTVLYKSENISNECVRARCELANIPGASRAVNQLLSEYPSKINKDKTLLQLFSIEHRLPLFSKPVLFIWGKHDQLAPIELEEKLQSLLPNCEFRELEDSGHMCYIDEPEKFNELALWFLQKNT